MGNDGNYDMAITISWFPSCIWTTDIWIKIIWNGTETLALTDALWELW